MMRSLRTLAGIIAVVISASPVAGQGINQECLVSPLDPPSRRVTQDACQKLIDLFSYMSPQLGVAVAGGNAVSGEHSTLGGPGRISWGVRANAIRARLPQIDRVTPGVNGAVVSDFGISEQIAPVPVVDGAFGALRGTPVSGTRILGADLLVSLSWVPSVSVGDVRLDVHGAGIRLGYGARVSIVEESPLTPGIAVTYIRRNLPRATLTASPGNDELMLDNMQMSARSWRAVIGKRFGPLAVSGGAGQDRVETSATATIRLDRAGFTTAAGPIGVLQQITRDNVFVSAALVLPLVRVVAEVGRTSGGPIATYNTFGATRAGDQVEFASIGLRFRW
ncbi:MAG: hypothetical protein ACT4OZ_09600 [Gemmatimonadota bacterium]